jgi:protein transport protein SEC31
MDDGSFRLWNPAEMISTYRPDFLPSFDALDAQSSIVYEEEAEEGGFPTMCCEWNSLKNNFLAFGGTDVLLLNVGKNPSEPELIKPGKKNPHVNSYVTSVSWNREVAHILASASENGLVALWDIKTNNSIFQFKDSAASSGSRNVVICWSKSISTQIAVTLDDEKRNELQIWDLRNQKGPVIVIDRLHTKGINAMDWCETDPELILSASRDNKLACWNYTQEEAPLSENTIENGVFTVKWSKKLPSIYAVSNEEVTTVYSLSDNLFGYVPKWYKVPVGSTILGSQAALTYSQQRGPVLVETKLSSHQSKNDPLRQDLKALGNALEGVFDERENESEVSALIKAKSSS